MDAPPSSYPSRGNISDGGEENNNHMNEKNTHTHTHTHVCVCNKRVCVDTEVIRFCHVFDCFEGIVSALRGHPPIMTDNNDTCKKICWIIAALYLLEG